MIIKHICEVCGKTENLEVGDAHVKGWDYPPYMGAYGVVSARTCPDCPLNETLWWAIIVDKKRIEDLSARHHDTLKRINAEPGSIKP